MNAEQKIANELAEKIADDRAYRIATIAAEDAVRCQGIATSGIDEYLILAGEEDDFMLDCIEHLRRLGEVALYETYNGIVVNFSVE